MSRKRVKTDPPERFMVRCFDHDCEDRGRIGELVEYVNPEEVLLKFKGGQILEFRGDQIEPTEEAVTH